MIDAEISKEEVVLMLESLKKEIGDKYCDMRAAPLQSVTADDLRENLISVINELWETTNVKLVLPEKPEIDIRIEKSGWLTAKPKNESAMRVMQLLNMTYPTHRLKKKGVVQ